jgi:2-polyprenyl-6-methoxyphenol hydroxylase-like FAD-dependent oxidoreductase
MQATRIGRRAVVIGAGMAGLPAARALADFFEEVVVLERDALPPNAAPRVGTPQARHTHALLNGGQRALGELFPGFVDDLAAAGAVAYGVGRDIRYERPGFDPFPARDLGLAGYAMSRPLIELAVRRRVEQRANILIRASCRAREMVGVTERAAVSAVRIENRDGNDETLAADLIVEASGRGALSLGFLAASGRPCPEETVIGVDITYATQTFAVPDSAPAGWKGVMTFDDPAEGGLAGVMLPLEGKRWIVTLVGRHGERPPDDREGFLAYAERLRTPTIHDAIRRAEPLTPVARFGFPASVRRHFDRLDEFPRGLLPFGDAICRFNPVYGQGMSVAAQEALLLRRLLCLRCNEPDALAGLAAAFFAEAAALIETPWALAALPDLAHPKATGERPDDLEERLRFAAALNRLAANDPAIHRLLFEVLQLVKPMSVLREPELVERAKTLAAA